MLIKIGSRGSKLALWQAHFTRDLLEAAGHQVEITIIRTKGDQIQNLSFDKLEGKGFFTREIEDALLQKQVDLAVHSCKDLSTEQPEGLELAAFSYREDPSDCLVIKKEGHDPLQPLQLKPAAIVGTSSARRKAQLLSFRKDLTIQDIRGNVPTRVRKLEEGYDAVVLATAGLNRLQLDLSAYHVVPLDVKQCIPAAAQGVLAYQIRTGEEELKGVIKQVLNDAQVEKVVQLERAVLAGLDGGCQQPIGIYAELHKETEFKLWASKADDFSSFPKRIYLEGTDKKTMITQAVNHLRNPFTPKKVFVSRHLAKDSYLLQSLETQGHEVLHHSLIDFKAVAFSTPPETDWLFFTSAKGVHYFFEQNPSIPNRVKWAAMGQGTARTLQKKGIQLDFIGTSGNSRQIAESFTKVASNQSVLFPIATKSLRNIQKNLPANIKSIDIIVYDNSQLIVKKIPYCDFLVFTSPNNVYAFFQLNSIVENQQVIAIGSTTSQALEAHNCTSYKIAYSPNEYALSDICY